LYAFLVPFLFHFNFLFPFPFLFLSIALIGLPVNVAIPFGLNLLFVMLFIAFREAIASKLEFVEFSEANNIYFVLQKIGFKAFCG